MKKITYQSGYAIPLVLFFLLFVFFFLSAFHFRTVVSSRAYYFLKYANILEGISLMDYRYFINQQKNSFIQGRIGNFTGFNGYFFISNNFSSYRLSSVSDLNYNFPINTLNYFPILENATRNYAFNLNRIRHFHSISRYPVVDFVISNNRKIVPVPGPTFLTSSNSVLADLLQENQTVFSHTEVLPKNVKYRFSLSIIPVSHLGLVSFHRGSPIVFPNQNIVTNIFAPYTTIQNPTVVNYPYPIPNSFTNPQNVYVNIYGSNYSYSSLQLEKNSIWKLDNFQLADIQNIVEVKFFLTNNTTTSRYDISLDRYTYSQSMVLLASNFVSHSPMLKKFIFNSSLIPDTIPLPRIIILEIDPNLVNQGYFIEVSDISKYSVRNEYLLLYSPNNIVISPSVTFNGSGKIPLFISPSIQYSPNSFLAVSHNNFWNNVPIVSGFYSDSRWSNSTISPTYNFSTYTAPQNSQPVLSEKIYFLTWCYD